MRQNENTAQALILVSGLVQGVYFRVYTRQQALALNLSGYAKNLPDGRVEIKAVGGKTEIEQLIAWCHQGSPQARVEQVSHQWQPPQPHAPDFSVC